MIMNSCSVKYVQRQATSTASKIYTWVIWGFTCGKNTTLSTKGWLVLNLSVNDCRQFVNSHHPVWYKKCNTFYQTEFTSGKIDKLAGLNKSNKCRLFRVSLSGHPCLYYVVTCKRSHDMGKGFSAFVTTTVAVILVVASA